MISKIIHKYLMDAKIFEIQWEQMIGIWLLYHDIPTLYSTIDIFIMNY